MGKGFIAILVGFFAIANVALADNPETINMGLKSALVVEGFDSNDVAEVVVAGEFNTGCFKVGPADARIVDGVIHIKQMAYRYSGRCPLMLVPFLSTVKVGVIREPGTYKIVDDTSLAPLGEITIVKATKDTPDDFLYAPVDEAPIDRAADGMNWELHLKGVFRDNCTTLDPRDVEIKYDPKQPVIIVLPKAVRDETKPCDRIMKEFNVAVPLRPGLAGLHLLHVRVLNGQSINRTPFFFAPELH